MTLRLIDMFVINSECTAGMALHIADNSIDAIVTDPPYGLSKEPDMTEVLCHWINGDDYEHGGSGFMGKTWDSFVPSPSVWREAFRCLKPGGYALVFAGSRTQDLMTTSLRLAGFEIHDTAMWLYGSGFPKSLNIGEGRGTALKPAYEPIIIARKPLDGTVRKNVEKWGTGTIDIDGCRIPTDDTLHAGSGGLLSHQRDNKEYPNGRDGEQSTNNSYSDKGGTNFAMKPGSRGGAPQGRWPANILHDGSDEVVELFPDSKGQQGDLKATGRSRPSSGRFGDMPPPHAHKARKEVSTSAARYFYCAKTSKADRNAGLDDFEHVGAGEMTGGRTEGSAGMNNPRAGAGRTGGAKNHHPTVKPTELMRWCCRLVGHPNALIMDPFSGSGSTGRGAALEGFGFIGFEMDPEYVEIANARISHAYSMLTR